MGKKYLDTKQDTIEAAVLDVWVDAAEEQEAIQSAARMVVDDTMGEQLMGPKARAAKQANWEKERADAKKKAEAEAKKQAKRDAQIAQDLPVPDSRLPAGTVVIGEPSDSKVGAKAGQLPSIGAQTAAAIAGTDKKTDDKKKEADPFKKHRIGDVAGPTGDIGKLPKIKAEPKKAKPFKDPDKGKKKKKKPDPSTQVQKGHRDYPQNPDKTFGPRHKWSRGKYAGSDDPRFSSDPRAANPGVQDMSYRPEDGDYLEERDDKHYQHELEVQEAIRNAANRIISEMELGAAGAIRTHKARDAERKKLGTGVHSRPVPKSKIKPPKVPAAPVGKVQAIELPKARLSPGALGGIRPDPKPKPKTKPGALGGKKPDTSARDYGGGPEIKPKTKPVMTKKQAAVAYGGGPEIGLQKKPTKPRTGIKPPSLSLIHI